MEYYFGLFLLTLHQNKPVLTVAKFYVGVIRDNKKSFPDECTVGISLTKLHI